MVAHGRVTIMKHGALFGCGKFAFAARSGGRIGARAIGIRLARTFGMSRPDALERLAA
jgi:hypothetical protein